jgi:hypothetical protein
MIPGWLAEAADQFWAEAGTPPPFPRDLTLPALGAFVVDRQVMPGLRLRGIEEWFAKRACALEFGQQDEAAEHRFTFAHELAHLMLDYLMPRNQAISRLGPDIADVLDGVREPTENERLDAAINACPLGLHLHLLERRDVTALVSMVESKADQLAWELLAPDEELERRFGSLQVSVAELSHGLVNEFGLPMPEATKYAGRWLRARQGPRPLIRLV